MNKKRSLKLLFAATAAIALLVPVRAMAVIRSVTDLQDAVKKSYALCVLDPNVYNDLCHYANSYGTSVNNIKDASAGQQNAAIHALKPDFETTYQQIKTLYDNAVANKQINRNGSITSGAAGGAETCGTGSDKVTVSIGVGCTGKSSNPIYDYLRGLILFMGSLIGIAIVITLIVAGIQYSASSGEPANIANAKDRIFNAAIGLILYILMAAILRYLIPNIFS